MTFAGCFSPKYLKKYQISITAKGIKEADSIFLVKYLSTSPSRSSEFCQWSRWHPNFTKNIRFSFFKEFRRHFFLRFHVVCTKNFKNDSFKDSFWKSEKNSHQIFRQIYWSRWFRLLCATTACSNQVKKAAFMSNIAAGYLGHYPMILLNQIKYFLFGYFLEKKYFLPDIIGKWIHILNNIGMA